MPSVRKPSAPCPTSTRQCPPSADVSFGTTRITTPALRAASPILASAPTFHSRPRRSATSCTGRPPRSGNVTMTISPRVAAFSRSARLSSRAFESAESTPAKSFTYPTGDGRGVPAGCCADAGAEAVSAPETSNTAVASAALSFWKVCTIVTVYRAVRSAAADVSVNTPTTHSLFRVALETTSVH